MSSEDSAYESQALSATTLNSEMPDSIGKSNDDSGKLNNSSPPNGYISIKSTNSVSQKHDFNQISEHRHSEPSSHHNSDHAKRKEGDSSKHSSSNSHKHSSEHKKHSNDSSKHSGDKHSSSSKSKESSSNKISKSSSNSISKDHHHPEKKHEHSKTDLDKSKKEKSSGDKPQHESSKKEKHHDDKHKEKSKDGHSSEHKSKDSTKDKIKSDGHKEKHGEKSKDKSDKSKEKSDVLKDKGDKPKEKSDKHKEKSDKPKEKSDKPKDKSDKPKDKSDKPKDKSDKPKDKSEIKPKEKGDKPKEKSDKIKDKPKEKSDKPKESKHPDKLKEKSSDKHSTEKKTTQEKEKKPVIVKTEIKVKSEPPSPEKMVNSSIKQEPDSPVKTKDESYSEDDVPLSSRRREATKPIKRELSDDEESDDEPLSSKIGKMKKTKTGSSATKTKKRKSDSDSDYDDSSFTKAKKRKGGSDDSDYDYEKPKKKTKKETAKQKKTPVKKGIKTEPSSPTSSPVKKGRAKKEDDQDVWKWWEEEKRADGTKWRTLEHKGPVFAPLYERVPKSVKFYYDGKHMELSEEAEEVAGFYGRMLDHDYTSKEAFNTNFFKDWRKVMTPEERAVIKDLTKCNFNDFNVYYKMKSEERKNMSKEEKQEIKKQNEALTQEYGYCIIDGHRQKIGNFKIEPPGLFRGRGEHPKMGMLKKRIQPEDVLINIGKEAKIPDPPAGHKWKEVRHDNSVTWLASWNENILNSTKYIMLNPSSKLKGEKDWQKYELARKLKNHAANIRNTYQQDFKSKEMKVRQRAVALYFIDKLALRAGNEKDEDTADTVGCCSLRVEHITLHEEKNGQPYVVSFDFLGKDSIRYVNDVSVEKRAFKNLKLFMENKQPGDDLFDRLNTGILNKYLTDLMEGLTAKVFRTYNASKTLQEQLDLLTKEEMSIPEKLLAYNRANRAVAILCNHQRSVPKTFDKSMENLKQKIDDKKDQIKECKKELKSMKSDNAAKAVVEKKKKRLAQLEDQLKRLEVQATDKEENKQIALGTSKLNYLDPRISVAWCKKWNVPIEKIYNRTQRDKFRWAIEMAGPDFSF